MATAERVGVLRFSVTERLVHWIHAGAFFALLATGVALYLPGLAGAFGSRAQVKAAHLYVAAGWIVALLLVAALGDRGRLGATRREIELFDSDDARWLRRRQAPQGRFNAGQKLHAVAQAAAATLFLLSGALLWYGERNTRFRLDGTILLHDALTVAATLLVIGHLYLAVVHPPTRPALRGMLSGSVDEEWSRRHHAKWPPQPSAEEGRAESSRLATLGLLVAAAAVLVLTVALVTASGP